MPRLSPPGLADLLRRRLDAARRRQDRGDLLLHGQHGEFLWVRSPECAELLPDGPVQMTVYEAERHALVTLVLDDEGRKDLATALWPDLVPAAEELPARRDVVAEPISLRDRVRLRRTDAAAGWSE